ncbi:unnamed protein product [Fraxinus pennsylvanica]|uniref:Uncharacterized protein n=1 Tax=Fraxinus pennsylvanica TaxID=56036 RepID=A0AAD2A2R4_9LAMI|nr:unnamed protein product [Fraxinus pennsylvanica]
MLQLRKEQLLQGKAKIGKMSRDLQVKYELLELASNTFSLIAYLNYFCGTTAWDAVGHRKVPAECNLVSPPRLRPPMGVNIRFVASGCASFHCVGAATHGVVMRHVKLLNVAIICFYHSAGPSISSFLLHYQLSRFTTVTCAEGTAWSWRYNSA